MNIDYRKALLFKMGNFSHVEDALAIEESLNIHINDRSFTVTMRTPGNDTELITGLLYTEEVYQDDPSAIKIIEVGKSNHGYTNEINITIPDHKILKDFEGSRNLVSASSCGLCGRTSFNETISKNRIDEHLLVAPELIDKMFDQMSAKQDLFKHTGGTHASAAFDSEGELLTIHEDIGRHNAVDKVIGSLLINGFIRKAKFLLVSGRVSYEIVNKCLSAGIPVLASVSAPSSMAVNDAEKAGITLMAFCRQQKLTVYTHPERIKQQINIPINQ